MAMMDQCLEEIEIYWSEFSELDQGQSSSDKITTKPLHDSWSPPLPIGCRSLAPNTQIPDDEIYAQKPERNCEDVSENITAHERFQPARAT